MDPSRAAAGVLRLVAQAARDVARLVVPVECPGCGRPDVLLCAPCAVPWAGPVQRRDRDVPRLDRLDGAGPLPVWAVAAYAGPVRGTVVAWKDRGRADLTRLVHRSAGRAGRAVAPVVGAAASDEEVLVVPVPSSPGARRRRGADLVGGLATAVAGGLVGAGVPARAVSVLRRRRGARDQVGLGARARTRNTAGRIRVRTWPTDPAGRWCVLVDDVVTTGSTLAACEDALSAAGGLVLGAVVLAATPPPDGRPAFLVRGRED